MDQSSGVNYAQVAASPPGVLHDVANLVTGLYGSIELLGQTSTLEPDLYQSILTTTADLQTLLLGSQTRQQLATCFKPDNELNRLLLSYQALIKSEQITVQTAFAPCCLKGHCLAFYRISANLFYNACQAVAKSDKQLKLIKLTSSYRDHFYCLEIADNGCGMSVRQLKQVGNSRVREVFNTGQHGLGLRVVRDLIKQFNGRLVFHSRLGVGTRVEVIIPQVH